MPRLRNSVQEAKEDLGYYFQNLAYGISITRAQFSSRDELVNFTILDVVTAMFHSLPLSSMERFMDNLDNISIGLKKFYEQEKNNASSKGKEG